nr:divalent metal cation transporter [Cytophagales bacterium]
MEGTPVLHRKWWKSLGPGLITAALVFGPGSLTVMSKLGAVYGYDLLWVLVGTTLLMMTFTAMSARIGLVSSVSLLQLFRNKWGGKAAVLTGVAVFFVTASFQAGNTIGAGIAFAESFQTSTTPWIVVISLLAISLLFFRSFYRILEKVMIAMVALMLVSFVFTVVLAKPDFANLSAGLIPRIPTGSLLLVVAMVASTFSIAGAFYQAYLVQEKGFGTSDMGLAVNEGLSGILVLGVISGMILISAAAILHPQGILVVAAVDMGKSLEPLYGNFATLVFMLGLFGASFSSLVGNATIGGTLVADALSLGRDLNSLPVKALITTVILIGTAVALLFGKLPLELIIFAQGITIFAVPFIGIGILMLANDSAVMGPHTNKIHHNILGVIGLLVLLFLAGTNFHALFLS